jgi:phage recombination protein Bet
MVFTKEQIQLLIQNKIIPAGCPQAQIEFFATVCEKKRLDPMLRQIHLVERNESDGKGGWKKSYTIQAGIDGMRVVAQRNCKIKSYRRWVEKREDDLYGICEIDTEDRGKYYDELPFEEYVQRKKDGTPNAFWMKFKQTMIKKCAEESVLRMMAPEDLSGVYGDDEMMQADTESNKIKELPVEVKQIGTVTIDPILNETAQEMFAPNGLDPVIVKRISEAMTTARLAEIFTELSEEDKPKYLDKLATRKAILKANKGVKK